MWLAAFLLACTAEVPETVAPPPAEEAPVEAPVKRKVTRAAWVGDWVMGDKILATDKQGQMKLMGDMGEVASGQLEGKGLRRTAALDGCGATLKLSEVGGDITVALSGPECPVEYAGTYINTVSP